MTRALLTTGQTYPDLEATLRLGDGEPIPFDEVREIRFRMRHVSDDEGDYTVSRRVDFDAQTPGVTRLAWGRGETDRPGEYRAGYRVRFRDGSVLPVPSGDDRLTIKILDDGLRS